jgi:multicomponent Na+:H+ antiporter subunit E
MTLLVLNLLLSLAWIALTGQFTPVNLLIGFLLGYLLLWIMQRGNRSSPYFFKSRQALSFALFFAWEIIRANARVAYDVVTPRHHMKPGIVAIPLDADTDNEITILANLITLTPGTLSLEVSPDRRILYIHAMYIQDADQFRLNIKEELERRLLEVLR